MGLSDEWEAEAAAWIAWARAPDHDSYWHFHRDAFFALVPPPGRLTVDVGCGEGRVARDLAARGHRTVGVDTSRTLTAAARAADPRGAYLRADAARLPLADGAADLVVAFMSLHDVDALDAALAECARVLDARGRLCAAVVHPINSAGAFDGEAADSPYVIRASYLDEHATHDTCARDGLRVTFHSRHRPLEAYSRALESAGLVVEALREPKARGAHAPTTERAERWRRVPLFLHLRARKAPA